MNLSSTLKRLVAVCALTAVAASPSVDDGLRPTDATIKLNPTFETDLEGDSLLLTFTIDCPEHPTARWSVGYAVDVKQVTPLGTAEAYTVLTHKVCEPGEVIVQRRLPSFGSDFTPELDPTSVSTSLEVRVIHSACLSRKGLDTYGQSLNGDHDWRCVNPRVADDWTIAVANDS